MNRARVLLLMLGLLLALMLPAQGQNSSANAASSQASAAQTPAKAPTTAEIAAAKAAGKVWVNLDSGIYHRAGRWYGKTKNGKFMTRDDAKRAGYKPAKRD